MYKYNIKQIQDKISILVTVSLFACIQPLITNELLNKKSKLSNKD